MARDRGRRPNERRRARRAQKPRATGNAAAVTADEEGLSDTEFELIGAELDRNGRTLTRVLFYVFLAIAVLMLAVAAMTGISTSRKLARERDALGQVTALTERKNSEGNSYFYPVVAFDVPDGGRFNVQLSEGSWPPSHRVGDLVTVLYDELDPMDARIQSAGGTAALWTWTLVTGILGVAFALAALLAWFMGR
jgi:hypothetical protein